MSCRVLVIDDSKFMRMMLGEILRDAGCEVIELDNGSDAVDMYAAHKPDLVTLDILMPEQDGLVTLQLLKHEYPNCRVVMVTALGMEDYLERAGASGADGAIIKPFSDAQVFGVLERVMGRPFASCSSDDEEENSAD